MKRSEIIGKIAGIVLACLVVSTMLPFGTLASENQVLAQAPKTWHVDDAGPDCPGADFSPIWKISDAASDLDMSRQLALGCDNETVVNSWSRDKKGIVSLSAIEQNKTSDQSILSVSGETIVVRLELLDIPSTLPFNQDFVPDNDLEYWWGINIDVDNNPNTGGCGYDVTISLVHWKQPGSQPYNATIYEGTEHYTWVWDDSLNSYIQGHEIEVNIDYANNTITMVASKAWEELSNLDENSTFDFDAVGTGPDGGDLDDTAVSDGSWVIDDPMGDVRYDFIDIIQGSLATGAPQCVITLEQCQSGAYIDPHLPLCWEISGVGIGDSFSICVSNSTASNDIKEVRFSSDDTQDGVPTGQWTEWYDWNTSSGDWHAGSKCMTWSFATGGKKEIWVELKDNAGQTSLCFKNIAVVPLPEWDGLPDTITLNEVAFSKWTQHVIAGLEKVGGVLLDPIPVFAHGSCTFTGEPVNIVLIVSPDGPRPMKYNLVKIRTNTIQGLTEDGLYATLESSGLLECAWNTVWEPIISVLSDFSGELTEEVADVIAEGLGISSFGLAMKISSFLECVTEGYTTKLKGYEHGKDYLVYLPVDYDFTITVQGAVIDWTCLMQAFVATHCPHSQFRGQKEVTVSDNLHDIYLDLQKAPWVFLSMFSPGELRVYDSQGRVTGLVSGEVRQEIPYSMYDDENKSVLICPATDSYYYEVVGTAEGNYGVRVISISEEDKVDIFALTHVPTSPNAVHQYTIDWDALSQGEEGVTVQIDSDSDGVFEETKILQPPIASFTFSPSNISVNEVINFNASQSSDVDGEIVSYEWNFGDENTSTGKIVTHAYSAPSEYLVSLTVVDNDGVVSTNSRTIKVGERQGMPTWGWVIIAIGILVLAIIVLGRRRAVKA